jgi:hypothetical protein
LAAWPNSLRQGLTPNKLGDGPSTPDPRVVCREALRRPARAGESFKVGQSKLERKGMQ